MWNMESFSLHTGDSQTASCNMHIDGPLAVLRGHEGKNVHQFWRLLIFCIIAQVLLTAFASIGLSICLFQQATTNAFSCGNLIQALTAGTEYNTVYAKCF